jgi:uridine phosphorylase
METSAIYGLSGLLGFDSISINAILANRLTGEFSLKPHKIIDKMIKNALETLCL